MVDGEIQTGASAGGRVLTLDPVMDREPLTVQPIRVETTIPCGFQVGWIDGSGLHEESGTEVDFDLCAGAGLGSRWLTLTVRVPGEPPRSECIDMQEFLGRWVDAVMAAGPSPVVSDG